MVRQELCWRRVLFASIPAPNVRKRLDCAAQCHRIFQVFAS
jgi:hypothetical protein